jgi:hypothetical protein
MLRCIETSSINVLFKTLFKASTCGMAFLCAAIAHAEVPAYVGQHSSTPEDIAAITKVTEEFKSALINKNAKQLSSLMLNSGILFSSAPSPEQIRGMHEKYDVNFDGIFSGGLGEFLQFIGKKGPAIEEKFYNMKITQDDHMAWVMFDFEFLEDNKTENYGIESWQLIKAADDKWKIVSVLWSSHPMPAQK